MCKTFMTDCPFSLVQVLTGDFLIRVVQICGVPLHWPVLPCTGAVLFQIEAWGS